jgi:hypothetical protein
VLSAWPLGAWGVDLSSGCPVQAVATAAAISTAARRGAIR